MTTSTKWIMANKLGLIILILLGLCIGSVVFVSVYPFTPIVYHKVELGQTVIRPGYTLNYTVYFTKYVNKVGSLSRYLISLNGESSVMLNAGLADAKITDGVKRNIVEIPHNTKPGIYKIKAVVVYDYFGIRQIRTALETPKFEVVK